jgi:hypothetical protein
MLLKQASTAEKFVVREKPSSEQDHKAGHHDDAT